MWVRLCVISSSYHNSLSLSHPLVLFHTLSPPSTSTSICVAIYHHGSAPFPSLQSFQLYPKWTPSTLKSKSFLKWVKYKNKRTCIEFSVFVELWCQVFHLHKITIYWLMSYRATSGQQFYTWSLLFIFKRQLFVKVFKWKVHFYPNPINTHVHMYVPLLRGLCLWQGSAIH